MNPAPSNQSNLQYNLQRTLEELSYSTVVHDKAGVVRPSTGYKRGGRPVDERGGATSIVVSELRFLLLSTHHGYRI